MLISSYLDSWKKRFDRIVMIFVKRLLWSAMTNAFTVWLLLDMNLWSDLEKVDSEGLLPTYDFIIGK